MQALVRTAEAYVLVVDATDQGDAARETLLDNARQELALMLDTRWSRQ